MTAEWTTRRPSGWPSDQPVWAITALLLALATIPALFFYQYRQEWTALERYYLGSYLRSQALAAMKRDSANRYTMIDVIDRKGYAVLTDNLRHFQKIPGVNVVQL